MPRPERPLVDSDGVLARFAGDLRRLREAAGSPGYREMGRRAHYSASTLSEAASGKRLPSLEVTRAYVRACDGDVEEWERRWRQVAAETAAGGAGGSAADGRVPYAGLAAFGPGDAEWYFGRERLTNQLVARVAEQRFVAVFGASGSGKSSLLGAGLVAAARAGKLGGDGALPVTMITPGPHPVAAADRVLRRGHPGTELLVVDQFEEIFTLCRSEAERSRFIDMLVDAATAPGDTHVVIGARTDFYTHCSAHPRLVAALQDTQFLVGPMGTEELRRAIVQPAVHAGCTVDGGLVAELIAEAAERPGTLPLVSHALLETFHRRRGNTLTLAGYQATGGIRDAAARTAEVTYSALSVERQAVARDLFRRLTALGEGTADTKRRIALAEFDRDRPDNGAVVDAFVRARLLTVDGATVQVAHEALIGSWPRLRGWLTEDRDGLRTHRQLTEAAQDWTALEKDPGALYRGARLAVAREWANRQDHREELNPLERAFLDASIDLRTKEQRTATRRSRQLRYLSLGLAVLLVAAVTVSVVAIRQRQDAVTARQIASSRQLATEALTMIDSSPGEAKQLGVAAFRIAPTTEARSALLSMSARREYIGEIHAHDGAVSEIAFAPGGRTLVSAGRDKSVALWDVAGRQRTATLTGHDTWLKAMAVSPDGTTIATGGDDHRLLLWDLAKRTPVAALTRHSGTIREIAISPDSRTVATASDDHTVMFWDVGTRAHAATLTGHTAPVVEVAFSPDGRTLATASDDGRVMLWDVASRTHVATLTGHRETVLTVAFSPDGTTLATGGVNNEVLLWDVASRTRVAILTGHVEKDGIVQAVEFSPDGRTLATANTDESIVLWDVRHRTQRARLTGHHTNVYTLAFHPTSTLLASAGEDGTIMLWDTAAASMRHPPGAAVNDIAVSPDGATLAAASTNQVTLWNTATRDPRTIIDGGTSVIKAVAFSHDNQTLAMAKSAERETLDGNTLALWNPAWANIELTGHTNTPLDVAFSPDGRTVATASSDKTVILWDAARRERKATLDVGSIANGLAFSPDGRTLAVGTHDHNQVTLWDLTTQTRTAVLSGHSGWVRTVLFSQDGATLVSASADQTVIVWDVATGTRLDRLTGHLDTDYTGVALSPDGKTLAYTSTDHTVLLWDTQHRTQLARLTGHTNNVTAVAFSPDGHTLASADADGTVILWDTDAERTAQRICDALTEAEWSQHNPALSYRETCDAT